MIIYNGIKIFQGMINVKKNIIDEKDRTPSCSICYYGIKLADSSGILCEKSGIRAFDSSCKKFKYDPLKRIPKKAPVMMDFSEEDFEI